ncbi:protein TonB, links inner and outer membranes [Actinacidiphila alni]|uniref:Protein TonB, links inner and outer membranes n=1 Tax=Actinacidiphila alni TaxID=380248 RepID=A0A1I2IZY6_9ACTN|nr:hypothetical protein [Actinacidiphila alni]SFF46256.1 protein TonB, links inner and outer membranes [Actinacidiphila alni]
MADANSVLGTIKLDDIYALGNAWIQLGDDLHERQGAVTTQVGELGMTGAAGDEARRAWNDSLKKTVDDAAETAWTIGETINRYGDELHKAAEEYAKQLNAEMWANILGIIAGLVLIGLGPLLSSLLTMIGQLLARLIPVLATIAGRLGTVGSTVVGAVGSAVVGAAFNLGFDIAVGEAGAAIAGGHYDVDWGAEGLSMGLGGAFGLHDGGMAGWHYGSGGPHSVPKPGPHGGDSPPVTVPKPNPHGGDPVPVGGDGHGVVPTPTRLTGGGEHPVPPPGGLDTHNISGRDTLSTNSGSADGNWAKYGPGHKVGSGQNGDGSSTSGRPAPRPEPKPEPKPEPEPKAVSGDGSSAGRGPGRTLGVDPQNPYGQPTYARPEPKPEPKPETKPETETVSGDGSSAGRGPGRTLDSAPDNPYGQPKYARPEPKSETNSGDGSSAGRGPGRTLGSAPDNPYGQPKYAHPDPQPDPAPTPGTKTHSGDGPVPDRGPGRTLGSAPDNPYGQPKYGHPDPQPEPTPGPGTKTSAHTGDGSNFSGPGHRLGAAPKDPWGTTAPRPEPAPKAPGGEGPGGAAPQVPSRQHGPGYDRPATLDDVPGAKSPSHGGPGGGTGEGNLRPNQGHGSQTYTETPPPAEHPANHPGADPGTRPGGKTDNAKPEPEPGTKVPAPETKTPAPEPKPDTKQPASESKPDTMEPTPTPTPVPGSKEPTPTPLPTTKEPTPPPTPGAKEPASAPGPNTQEPRPNTKEPTPVPPPDGKQPAPGTKPGAQEPEPVPRTNSGGDRTGQSHSSAPKSQTHSGGSGAGHDTSGTSKTSGTSESSGTPVTSDTSPSSGLSDFDRVVLAQEINRELRRLDPSHPPVSASDVPDLHAELPDWRQRMPLRPRGEAIAQGLVTGRPVRLPGGSPSYGHSGGGGHYTELMDVDDGPGMPPPAPPRRRSSSFSFDQQQIRDAQRQAHQQRRAPGFSRRPTAGDPMELDPPRSSSGFGPGSRPPTSRPSSSRPPLSRQPSSRQPSSRQPPSRQASFGPAPRVPGPGRLPGGRDLPPPPPRRGVGPRPGPMPLPQRPPAHAAPSGRIPPRPLADELDLMDVGQDVMHQVSAALPYGSANQSSAVAASGGASREINHQARGVPRIPPSSLQEQLGQSAAQAHSVGTGNCGENAALSFSYLNQRQLPPGARIWYVDLNLRPGEDPAHPIAPYTDHVFIAVGFPNRPRTIVIIDPWQLNARPIMAGDRAFSFPFLVGPAEAPRITPRAVELTPDGRDYLGQGYASFDPGSLDFMHYSYEPVPVGAMPGQPGMYEHRMPGSDVFRFPDSPEWNRYLDQRRHGHERPPGSGRDRGFERGPDRGFERGPDRGFGRGPDRGFGQGPGFGGLRGGSPDVGRDPVQEQWPIGREVVLTEPRSGTGLARGPVPEAPRGATGEGARGGYRPVDLPPPHEGTGSSSRPLGYEVDPGGRIRLPDGTELSPDGWRSYGDDFIHTPTGAILRGDDGWIGRVQNIEQITDMWDHFDPAATAHTPVLSDTGLHMVPEDLGGHAVHIPVRPRDLPTTSPTPTTSPNPAPSAEEAAHPSGTSGLSDFDRTVLAVDINRELRRLDPTHPPVRASDVPDLHAALPDWRQRTPLRSRGEAIAQTLVAGRPFRLLGGSPSYGWSSGGGGGHYTEVMEVDDGPGMPPPPREYDTPVGSSPFRPYSGHSSHSSHSSHTSPADRSDRYLEHERRRRIHETRRSAQERHRRALDAMELDPPRSSSSGYAAGARPPAARPASSRPAPRVPGAGRLVSRRDAPIRAASGMGPRYAPRSVPGRRPSARSGLSGTLIRTPLAEEVRLLEVAQDVLQQTSAILHRGQANQATPVAQSGGANLELNHHARSVPRAPALNLRARLGQSAAQAQAVATGNCGEHAAVAYTLLNQRQLPEGVRIWYADLNRGPGEDPENPIAPYTDHVFIAVGYPDRPYNIVILDAWQLNATPVMAGDPAFSFPFLVPTPAGPRITPRAVELLPDGRDYMAEGHTSFAPGAFEGLQRSYPQGRAPLPPEVVLARPSIYEHRMPPAVQDPYRYPDTPGWDAYRRHRMPRRDIGTRPGPAADPWDDPRDEMEDVRWDGGGGLRGGSPDVGRDPIREQWPVGREVVLTEPRVGTALVRGPVPVAPRGATGDAAGGFRAFDLPLPPESTGTSSRPLGYEVDPGGRIRLPDGTELSPDGWRSYGDDFIHTPTGAILRGDDGWIGRVQNIEQVTDMWDEFDPFATAYRPLPSVVGLHMVPAASSSGARVVHVPVLPRDGFWAPPPATAPTPSPVRAPDPAPTSAPAQARGRTSAATSAPARALGRTPNPAPAATPNPSPAPAPIRTPDPAPTPVPAAVPDAVSASPREQLAGRGLVPLHILDQGDPLTNVLTAVAPGESGRLVGHGRPAGARELRDALADALAADLRRPPQERGLWPLLSGLTRPGGTAPLVRGAPGDPGDPDDPGSAAYDAVGALRTGGGAGTDGGAGTATSGWLLLAVAAAVLGLHLTVLPPDGTPWTAGPADGRPVVILRLDDPAPHTAHWAATEPARPAAPAERRPVTASVPVPRASAAAPAPGPEVFFGADPRPGTPR